MNEKDQKLSEVGRIFPWEFVDMISLHAHQVGCEWLRENGAPQILIDVIDHSFYLQTIREHIKSGELQEWDAANLPGSIAEITKGIAELGGVFQDSLTSSNPRNPIVWDPLQDPELAEKS
jgi:hypothetical protein